MEKRKYKVVIAQSGKLDEAIDDMESDRVQIVEEAWAEIDAI